MQIPISNITAILNSQKNIDNSTSRNFTTDTLPFIKGNDFLVTNFSSHESLKVFIKQTCHK